MNRGFVMVPRELQNTECYERPGDISVYIHCQMRANISDCTYGGISLKANQFLTSAEKLSRECGLSIKQTRGAIKRLQESRLIRTERAGEGTKSGTIITVAGIKKDGSLCYEEGKEQDKEPGNCIKRITNNDNQAPVYKEWPERDEPSPAVETGVLCNEKPKGNIFSKNVAEIASFFRDNGLVYTDNGKGGSLEGMIGKRLKRGNTVDQMKRTIQRMKKEVDMRRLKNDDAAYFLAVLDDIEMEEVSKAV